MRTGETPSWSASGERRRSTSNEGARNDDIMITPITFDSTDQSPGGADSTI